MTPQAKAAAALADSGWAGMTESDATDVLTHRGIPIHTADDLEEVMRDAGVFRNDPVRAHLNANIGERV